MASVAEALVQLLEAAGARRVYGIIGTSLLGIYDALYNARDRINAVTTRHEQGAVSMADAEARVTGRPGFALVHAGPGLLNAMLSIGIAWKDRSPLMVIVGGVRRRLRGTDAWLEAPLSDIARPITRGYETLQDPRDIWELFPRLLHQALQPPRGPVVLEVPEDMWKLPAGSPGSAIEEVSQALSQQPEEGEAERFAREAAEALEAARRPLILACGELAWSPRFSQDRLLRLAERTGAYIVTSGNGRGACPEDHPRCLGRAGFGGGGLAADEALRRADLLLVLGNELDDITTYAYSLAPEGDILVASLDPSVARRPLLYDHYKADPGAALERLLEQAPRSGSEEWDRAVRALRERWERVVEESARSSLSGMLFHAIDMALPRDRIVAAGQGTHILYTYDYLHIYRPRSFLAATNLGAMSFALPAGIGVKLALPDRKVLAVAGDGELLMTVQELETAVRERAPLGIVVVNDGSYRVLYLKQLIQYQGRVYETLIGNPDYELLAKAFGLHYIRVTRENTKETARLLALQEKPVLAELRADPSELPPLNLDATLAMSK